MPRAPLSAFDAAVRLLAGREKTRRQVMRALELKGHARAAIEAALQRLEALGYLDDARAAERMARAGAGQLRSRQEVLRRLDAAGVDELTAARAVAAAGEDGGTSDEERARALLTRRRLTGVKAARFLLSRGFEEDVVRRLVPLVDGAPEGS